jgi:hypothetical protein
VLGTAKTAKQKLGDPHLREDEREASKTRLPGLFELAAADVFLWK